MSSVFRKMYSVSGRQGNGDRKCGTERVLSEKKRPFHGAKGCGKDVFKFHARYQPLLIS